MTLPSINMAKTAKSLNKVERSLKNRPVFISLIIINALVYAVLLILNYFAGNPASSYGLFHYGISNVSRMYPVGITPAGWAFSIWGLIFLLQLAWIIYSLSLLCRVTEGGPAYLNPVVLSPPFFIFFNLSSAFVIAWLFMWDRLLFFATFIFLACTAMSLYLAVSIVAMRLVKFQNELVDEGRRVEVTFMRIAVINGLSMYATWTTVATLINVAIILVYKLDMLQENAAIISLSVLAGLTLVYTLMDFSVSETFTRYNISPYLTIIWALAAVAAKHWNPDNVSSIITAVLIAFTSLAVVVKLGRTFYKASKEQYQYRQMKCRLSGDQ